MACLRAGARLWETQGDSKHWNSAPANVATGVSLVNIRLFPLFNIRFLRCFRI